jgi:putative membrane protein
MIKNKKIAWHRISMMSAFILSAIFLVSYVISKLSNSPVPFEGEGFVKYLYFFILITHIVLSVPVLPLALLAIYRGVTGEFEKHVKIVKWTFPIWMYVAITGVLVYIFMMPYYA